MSNPPAIQDSRSSHPGTVSQLREQDRLDVDIETDRHDCVTEGLPINEKIAQDRHRRSLSPSTAGELPVGKEGDNNRAPKAGGQSDGIRRRGNESSSQQNDDGGTYYTGRQNTVNQNGGTQNGGQQSGGHQNGGSGNGAPNQNGGSPNQNGGPNRDGGPGGDRSSPSSDGSSSSSSLSRNTNGSNDADHVSDNGTSRSIQTTGPPADVNPGDGGRGTREGGDPDDDCGDDGSSDDSSSDTERTHGTNSSHSVHVSDDDNFYGPDSSESEITVRAPSPESTLSDDTVNGPTMSPLLENFDYNAGHEPNMPGAYDITIGRWIMPTRHNGNRDHQNIVHPRIDASHRMTYRILPRDGQGRDVRMPRLPGGRRQRQTASERLLRARLTPAQAQQGYFEYEPRYAAAGVGARRLVDQDIAARRWAQMQQTQIEDQEHRRAGYPLAVRTFQSRQEFEETEASERRQTLRRLRRRDIERFIRRTARQLDRSWARRRLRYPWWG